MAPGPSHAQVAAAFSRLSAPASGARRARGDFYAALEWGYCLIPTSRNHLYYLLLDIDQPCQCRHRMLMLELTARARMRKAVDIERVIRIPRIDACAYAS